MQMYTLMPAHIMRFTRINVEIRLRTGRNTGLQERISMLGHDHRIVQTDDDLEFPLEILCFLKE